MISCISLLFRPVGAGRGAGVRVLVLAVAISLSTGVEAAIKDARVSFFGHADLQQAFRGQDSEEDRFTLGESALFGYLSPVDKVSFNVELSYQPRRYRVDPFKVERFMMRYEAGEKFWLGLGKMHTPVNYWNDNFHHGRLMFPTIDRPLSFERFIPIHETGVRLAGRRLGSHNLHFDLVVSSGQASEGRLFARGVQSFTARVGLSPIRGMDLQAAYYEHDGDSQGLLNFDASGGRLRTESHELTGLSVSFRGERWVALTEVAYARFLYSRERDFAAYQYIGRKTDRGIRPYAYADYLYVNSGEFREAERSKFRTGLGAAFMLAPTSDLKMQLEWQHYKFVDSESSGLVLKLQFAFGF